MSKPTLYVASGNQGKLRDFAVAAAAMSSGWQIATLPGLAELAAPPEDGSSFEENAQTKALYYGGTAPDSVVLADDSGLVVDALEGAPGIYSARYAERMGYTLAGVTDDERNNRCLLAELARSHAARRTAHYRCSLVAVRQGTVLAVAEGTVRGEILAQPRGTGGFGYDPLFLLPGLGLTMAEVDPETRLSLSHRGAALRKLLPMLAELA